MTISNRTRTATLWTAQSILAALFLFAGGAKFVLPADVLAGPFGIPVAFIRFIGVCEVLGALGLVLPGIFRVRVGLTPLAAIGLLCIMAGATTLSVIALGVGAGIVPGVAGAIAAAIAYARRDRLAWPRAARASGVSHARTRLAHQGA